MAEFIYAPILKWKKGEKKALENLLPEDKNKISPIIHFVEEFQESKFLEEINNLFGSYNNVFIPSTVYKKYFPENIIPVFDYSNYKKYFGKKAIFITEENMENIVLQNDNNNDDLYVILDVYKLYERNMIGYKNYLVNSFIKNNYNLLSLEKVKGIIISCTSFPDTEISNNLSTNTIAEYPKFELEVFSNVKNNFSEFLNKLIFSDYGTTRFTNDMPEGENFFFSNAADKIKYSTDDKYIFLKGKKGVKNYIELAKELVRHPNFKHNFTSFGNVEIKNKATGNNGVGNHTNWVTYCCNHHIVLVLRQLEQLFGL